ncbi:MAG: TIGR03086 family metal-binding protein [Nocardioidaceae bacterium]
MPTGAAPAPLIGSLGLLERAIGYTRGSLQLVTDADLTLATPCREWNLRALLRHMNDSLAALQQAADVGYVELDPVGADTSRDIVATIRIRACSLLGSWTHNDGATLVRVADSALTASVLASTGALEIAVHGWDVSQACRHDPGLPPRLAEELLELVPLLVSNRDRPERFAPSVDVPPFASPADRLLAFLGRHP